MAKDKISINQNSDAKEKRKRIIKVPINDGMNTPVPDKAEIPLISKSEEKLYKQANNPLGDPNKT
jgi:hypothetical protein